MRFFSTVVTYLLSISVVWSLPVPVVFNNIQIENIAVMINEDRANNNIPPLTITPCLNAVAHEKNQEQNVYAGSAYSNSINHQINSNQCNSEIPSNVRVVGWACSATSDDFQSEMIQRNVFNESKRSSYKYIGLDVVQSAFGGGLCTIVLA
jgi:hypothetical protein